MHIEISDKRTVREIQEDFNAQYPFLKLEFFKRPHQWMEPSAAEDVIEPDKAIGEIRRKHKSGLIELRDNETTGKLEQHLKDRFGLNVQVYRRHCSTWVQTAGTDRLSLREQNEVGRENCGPDHYFHYHHDIQS